MQTFQCNNIPATARIVVRESQYQRMTISNVNTNDDGHSFTFVESLRDVVLISTLPRGFRFVYPLFRGCFFFWGGGVGFGFFFLQSGNVSLIHVPIRKLKQIQRQFESKKLYLDVSVRPDF